MQKREMLVLLDYWSKLLFKMWNILLSDSSINPLPNYLISSELYKQRNSEFIITLQNKNKKNRHLLKRYEKVLFRKVNQENLKGMLHKI